ncbi:hypothetical protein BDR06DRAFT_1015476 [Suillus hirtellus]|nr:hypothetical protein BDR06DRAFT_1015476 [Suillus hirtellus]
MENTIPNIPVESVSAIVQAVDPNEPPPKRKPGQPKGSGKKQPPDPTIISKRSSIQWVALAYYPQHPGIPPPWQGFTPQAPQSIPPITNGNAVPNTQHPSIDPNLNCDEWAELSCTKPNILMQSLLGAITAPNPIASRGLTVEEAFRSHLASLMPSQNQNKDAHSIPSLYSVLRTLWLPSSPSYLSLIAPQTTA